MSKINKKLLNSDKTNQAEVSKGQIPGLLYADDIFLSSNTADGLRNLLKIAEEFSNETGLKFSESKCKILSFSNSTDTSKEVFALNGKHLEKVSQYKYLGVIFNDDAKHYLVEHEKTLIEKAWRLFGALKQKIRCAFNKFKVGKTLWKAVAVPALTFGSDALVIKESTLSKLTSIQNAMGRFFMGANCHCAIAALDGDIGWSSFASRDVANKLRYKSRLNRVKHKLTAHHGDFDCNEKRNTTSWLRRTKHLSKTYLKPGGIELSNLKRKDVAKVVIDAAVNYVHEEKWLDNIRQKSTLSVYGTEQRFGGRDEFWDNSLGSSLLFKARSDTLELNAMKKRWCLMSSPNCTLCATGVSESLTHFLLYCPQLEQVRARETSASVSAVLNQNTSDEEKLVALLHCGADLAPARHVSETKRFLERLWQARRKAYS